MPAGPCTGAQRRKLPTGHSSLADRRGTSPPQVFETQGAVGGSRRPARLHETNRAKSFRKVQGAYLLSALASQRRRIPACARKSPSRRLGASLAHTRRMAATGQRRGHRRRELLLRKRWLTARPGQPTCASHGMGVPPLEGRCCRPEVLRPSLGAIGRPRCGRPSIAYGRRPVAPGFDGFRTWPVRVFMRSLSLLLAVRGNPGDFRDPFRPTYQVFRPWNDRLC